MYQGAIVHGRGDVAFYNENGYVPAPDGSTWDRPQQSARSASRTVEYARNDFAIALAAHGMLLLSNVKTKLRYVPSFHAETSFKTTKK